MSAHEPIAIVGVGAVFPGAGSAAALWRNVRAGTDAITEVPAHRWDPDLYYDPDAHRAAPRGDRFYCRRGGFVDDLATFDPARFGIMPAAVAGMEPDQLLALRTAAEALADAGGAERLPDRARVGVVIGRGGYITPGVARFDQRVRTSHQLASVLAELLPEVDAGRIEEIRRAFCDRLGPDGPDASVGLVPNFAASRIANRFDLRGPAYTLDAACASSLLAVEHAVRALRGGQCDAMLAGAVHHAHHATVWSVFSQLRALSPSGRIRPFDRSADGTLLSEGTGMVLLKRLADAERAGDRVYAVVRGVGSASDGRAASLMSPLVEGQVLAVERAWADAGLDPAAADAVGLVEAHGTGTPAGDEAELATLRRVFGTAGPPLPIGTVKSMIGHAMPAGGIAGLIKAAFALRDGVLPPTLHVEEPHPAMAGTRLTPVHVAADWERPPTAPRRAVVNAFGFGGANAHVILEEPPGAGHPAPRILSAPRDGGEAVLRLSAASAAELAALLDGDDDALLARAGEEPADLPCRLAIVGPTARGLDLARAVARRGTPWRGRSDIWFTPRPLLADGGRVAFLYPGFEPAFQPRVDDVADRLGLPRPRLTGRDDLVGHASDVMAVGLLLTRALAGLGVEPDVAAGHSLGEWTAMIAAGMYEPDAVDAFLAAVDHDGLDVPDVAYAALGCGADRAAEAAARAEGVVVSHDNCPHQSVVCGPPDQVREVLARLAADGVMGQELPFRSGFHTPMAEAYLESAHRSFDALPIRPARVPLWSATTAAPFPAEPARIRELIVRHLLEPVRFGALTEELHAAGVRAFVQVGPGGLAGFVGDRLGDRDHLAMAANVPRRDGMAQLRRVVAALWVEGHGSRARAAGHDGPSAVRLDLGTPLVRLDGAVPPLRIAEPAPAGPPVAPPATGPVVAELDALLRDAAASARSVVDALHTTAPPRAAERTTRRTFSLETMPYVRDHCLVPQRADWPDLSDRFPVVPLTTLLEVMADAARELFPGLVVVGVENVRALRWLVAVPATTTDVHARREPAPPAPGAPRRVKVVVRGHADGTVLLAERHPAPPAPDRTPLTGEAPPPVTAERLYAERYMFHGPLYRGVTGIDALAADGLRGTLTALPTPGALMDSAGQLCGHWIQIHGDRDQTVFPVGVERVTWYGPPPPDGERLTATVRNRSVSDTAIRSDCELVGADGRVWCRVEGWSTRRIHTDGPVWRLRFTPEVSAVGEPREGGWTLARRRWDGGAARDLLMRQYLNAAERAEYQALTPRARGPWLLGRIAAKDAVRHRLWERGHGPLFPAELTVRNDAAGRPEVTGPFDEPLAVSIAHTPDLGVALVRAGGEPAGIDVERAGAGAAAVETVALTEGERDLLASMSGDRATAATRLWTAKEAVAKAAGTGLRGRPRDFVVTAADPDRLLVGNGGTVTVVRSTLVDGHVVTWTDTAGHTAAAGTGAQDTGENRT
ncbi:beta-ketoacyl synthase N-terminal-like domain-containing protein [Actinomadura namibiensis]|uniref:Acyl transferase domain-containing protein/phosphopantetheinyl transferase n=1 Tax=Actinomadura namibiensis TaxID=182080 RepID=A0A7W3QLT6_ACTNM|nr:beta-ketoacyl synthase N-terminal-like domain-containing protein [Actinomadura namibiensis]MBA8951869.1 acyl transferase domain-containing protein/phosphopantetheinyl transferase [Actinomadura namibiensis]